MKTWRTVLVPLLLVLGACGESEPLTGPPAQPDAAMSISDAVHEGGSLRLFFLPPMVPNPAPFGGAFDASASPEVRICAWRGAACVGGDVATFDLTSTPRLVVDTAEESFKVNWKSKGHGSDPGDVYRIRVYLGSMLLGHADVKVVASGRQKKAVGSDYVALLRDAPLLIKFRIEEETAESGRIAFSSSRDGNPEIYVMNADGTDPMRLTNSSRWDNEPGWSPDGSRIAFASDRDFDYEVYVMNADGSDPTNLTNQALSTDSDPAWSPDGSHIAFVSDRDFEEIGEIYVMDADGTGQTRLTDDGQGAYEPDWSPDGSKIVFTSDRDGDLETFVNHEVFVMNADGSGQTNLTNRDGNDQNPAWSPDGTRIAFASRRDGNLDIYVMNADGTDPVRLTDHPGADLSPAWSPDGTRIAFQTDRDGNWEVYVMDVHGSGQTNLTNHEAFDGSPAWDP